MEQMKFINKDKKHKYIIHNAIKELVTVFEVNFDTPSTQNHGNFRITCWSTYPNCTQRKVFMVQECRIRNTQIRQCPQNIMHSQIHPCDSGNVCIRPKPAPEATVPRLLGVSLRFCIFWLHSLKAYYFKIYYQCLKYHQGPFNTCTICMHRINLVLPTDSWLVGSLLLSF